MFTAFVVVAGAIFIFVVVVNARAIWYARSGQYEIDRRLDAASK